MISGRRVVNLGGIGYVSAGTEWEGKEGVLNC